MKLSKVVARTSEIVRESHVNYGMAASIALGEAGCSNRRIRVGESRLENDVGAKNSDTLLHAVTSALGKKGSEKKAVIREQARQTEFALS